MLSLITDKSKVVLGSIKFNEDHYRLIIPIKRLLILNIKKNIFGIRKASYSKEIINSILEINDVIDYKIIIPDSLKELTEFTALFGFEYKNGIIYLNSAEESYGDTIEIKININNFNVTMKDT